MSILLPGTLKTSCRNWDESWLMTIEAVRKFGNLFHDMSWSGLGSRRTVCSVVTTGIFKRAQQMQDMASGRAAEDSILMLQADHVDAVEVQKFSGFLIRLQIVLRQ